MTDWKSPAEFRFAMVVTQDGFAFRPDGLQIHSTILHHDLSNRPVGFLGREILKQVRPFQADAKFESTSAVLFMRTERLAPSGEQNRKDD